MRHLSRSALLQRMLVALPAWQLASTPLPAVALLGEAIGDGFFQADDKSFDFTLPSPAWKIDATKAPRAEHPARLFHVTAERAGGATLDLTVVPSGKKAASELGKVDAVGAELASSFGGELVSAEVVPGSVKGSKYYTLVYRLPSGGTTTVKLDAKQGRTYTLAVSLPAKPADDLRSEADSLLKSFKCFPVNIICVTQSNSGATPVSGSCY
jgi:hypothetical protein